MIMNREKILILICKGISAIFNPFYAALFSFAMMFILTFLYILPWQYKMFVLSIILVFTIIIPMVSIWTYVKINKVKIKGLSVKENRAVPYVLTFISYFFGFLLMRRLAIPSYMHGLLIAFLVTLSVSAIINMKWKICIHTAAIGVITGAYVMFDKMFPIYPLTGLSILILVAGLLGTSRMILREHTLAQVIAGYFNGFVCAIASIYLF